MGSPITVSWLGLLGIFVAGVVVGWLAATASVRGAAKVSLAAPDGSSLPPRTITNGSIFFGTEVSSVNFSPNGLTLASA